ncbi:MAG: hypothetical protein V4671_17245 [Armatimonadota bacterium]
MALNFSGLTLKQAMRLVPSEYLLPWQIEAPPLSPSDILSANLLRLEVFDLTNSEAAKILLIDVLFAEVVPHHAPLKIWKSEPLESDILTGIADYLIAPKRAYAATPLLCVAEAKRDDFVQGRAQCIAEMVACRWNNTRDGLEIPVHGIVSNGNDWQFYKLTPTNDVYETSMYSIRALTELLGVLDYICSECAKNAP